MISATDLILNPDGTVYHLHLAPHQIASTIITVGDPERVAQISSRFSVIEYRVQNREFLTHTGVFNGKRLTVISTGIGTDNIDIVLNELDALVNIDLGTRTIKDTVTPLTFVRIGTSGSLQKDLPVDSLLVSSYAVGLDSLMHFYQAESTAKEATMADFMMDYFEKRSELLLMPYVFDADKDLLASFTHPDVVRGVTVTCPGFYAPQGRILRGKTEDPKFLASLVAFKYQGLKLNNIEMETAAIYGLARLLGHQAISFNAILANRLDHSFSVDPQKTIDGLIDLVLEWLTRQD